MNVSEGLRAYQAAILAMSVWNDEDTLTLARSYGATALLDKMHLGQQLIPAVMKRGSGFEASRNVAQARLGGQVRPGTQARPGAQVSHD